VEPALVWAVMRRESAFKPDVSSAADARGLMQIIPPTARAIARELKEPEPDADALFAPELNVSQATWYLKALRERFEHVALVAGAYNAGPGAVARWLEARGSRPLDEFIEEISYKETRGYVRQVTADYFVYRALYGEPDAKAERLSLTLPAPRAQGVAF
jgi:soluble lytic murein transglycosylase